MLKKTIYLDYASTTPIDPLVTQEMQKILNLENGLFGNSSSTHIYGYYAKKYIENAREKIAKTIGAVDTHEIIWTSGATESINLAIKGYVYANSYKGNHIITTKIEHQSVLNTCRFLEKKGFFITYLKPKSNGLIDVEDLEKSISSQTILISIIWVNNETGMIQPIKKCVEIAKKYEIAIHVDSVQAIGRLNINMNSLEIDLASFSAHKIYGPKGIGALYIRRKGKPQIKLQPLIHGGGHEYGIRSGTLATHQIVGMGVACEIIFNQLQKDYLHLKKIRNIFLKKIQEFPNIILHGDVSKMSPHIVNICFKNIDGEELVTRMKNIAVSSGSSCSSLEIKKFSHVLFAMGISIVNANNSIRFSFGRFTTIDDIYKALYEIKVQIKKIQNYSSWDINL